ncbi:MAG: two-CW domain-containing protein, partial [Planctomycetaceae bacterium]
IRAVQSFEQGWRKIPGHIERQMLFLKAMKKGVKKLLPCWEIRGCSPQARQACPAWEFRVGHLCWYINGTICRGKVQESWKKKIAACRECKVFHQNLET